MNKLICIFSLTLVASLTLCAQPVKATRAEAVKDPVIKAMLEELDRSKAELQLKDPDVA